MLDPQLKDKVVMVTGASNPHGIGTGVARVFAAQGAKIFLHYFRQSGPVIPNSEPGAATVSGPPFYWSQVVLAANDSLELREILFRTQVVIQFLSRCLLHIACALCWSPFVHQ